MAQDDDWNMRIAKRVGQEVARTRERARDSAGRKLSAQALSDRCASLGHPLDRSVIAKLENGKRQSVTAADLLVLARALEIPPLALLFPVGYTDETEVLPGRTEHPMTGLRWASGEGTLPVRDGIDRGLLARWRDSAIFWVRKLMKDEETVRYNRQRASEHWRRAAQADSDDAREAFERMARTAEEAAAQQQQVIDHWRTDVETSRGIAASTPELYGEIPGNMLASPGGDLSSW